MSVDYIDAGMLKKMFVSGAYNLEKNKELINELNVFPVPDGDTGTNMSLTIFSAVDELNAAGSDDLESIAKAISHGSLRGARGNSGVILSQLLRGFTKEISSCEKVDSVTLARACERAVETAYKAVMKPQEGTILTVARGIARKAAQAAKENAHIRTLIEEALEEGKAVLRSTPELLPVLKEAGVVDSGGQGLVIIIEGAYKAFIGEEIERPKSEERSKTKQREPSVSVRRPEGEIKFGYCTEFIVNIEKALTASEAEEMKAFLDSIGDSVVFVPDDDLIKVHVHTNEPGTVIQKALTYGELRSIKIDNMREEHREMLKLNPDSQDKTESGTEKKKYGFIGVCAGDGFKAIYEDMGTDVVINGGQTMNPSTDDFLGAIKKINAENIFIFPNNKNIIMAANQARDLTKDKNVFVIPTKTVTQGITALLSYAEEAEAEANADFMTDAMKTVRSSQVTYSIRDTHVDGFDIKAGDIMAVGDAGLLSVGTSINEVAFESVERLADEDTELISVYYGEDYDVQDAEKLSEELQERYPECEVALIEGRQPVYYCIISVE